MRLALNAVAAVAVVVASLLSFSGTASAHERRMVGPYQFVVGFLGEPAYAGNTNGLDLRITDTRSNNPVEGLEKTLTADVSAGGLKPLPLTISARFGQPGAYNGNFMPTAPGAYVFHITGKIDTQSVDEKFESGPGRFNDVESTSALQYPTKVPTGADLGNQLASIQSDLGQIRILAAIAIALGVIAIAAPLVMRRGRGAM